MKIERRLDPGHQVVEILVEGPLHLDEMLADISSFLTEHPDPGSPNYLLDLTRGSLELGFEEAQQFVLQGRPLFERLGPGKWAVAAPGDANFGVARMVSALAEELGVQCGVFRDRAAALAWIEA